MTDAGTPFGMAGALSPQKGHPVSRPKAKLPDVSWHQCRIAATIVLAIGLTAAYLIPPATAQPHHPPHEQRRLTPSATSLDEILGTGRSGTIKALKSQSAAQAAAHHQAVAKARQAHMAARARAAAAREREAAQRAAAQRAEEHTSRSAERPALAAPATTVTGARAYAQARMPSAQYRCLNSLVARESGWNHRAQNPASGAYGLFQALPGSKMSSAGSDWQSNPLTQMRWGLSYIKGRYQTPCGAWYFWTKNGWY